MNTLEGLPMLSHYRKLIVTGEEGYAWDILHEFFEAFEEEGPQELLWFMLCAAMKLDNDDMSGKERSNLLFFYEYSQALFRAIYSLYQHHHKEIAQPEADMEEP